MQGRSADFSGGPRPSDRGKWAEQEQTSLCEIWKRRRGKSRQILRSAVIFFKRVYVATIR